MDKEKFLATLPLFADLSEKQIRTIGHDVIARRYERGTTIFNEGDSGQMLYILKTGKVSIFVVNQDGNVTPVILFGQPGDLFGELSIIDGLPRSATAVAVEDTVLFTISREPFRNHMRRAPQFAMNFMQVLSQRVRYNTHQLDTFTSLTVSQRLARKLLELAHDFGCVVDDGIFIDMYLPQDVLATMIAASREMVNRCQRKFRDRGWIKAEQGNVTILDPEALRSEVSG